MKTKNIIFAAIFCVGFFFTACKSSEKKEENRVEVNSKKNELAKDVYQCPMECEGEKTYTDKDTKCPVCNMKLKKKISED